MTEVQLNPRDHELVLVTGASGFIGSQVVDLLLRNEYRVRGTVRCLRNEVKIRPLLNLCPDLLLRIEYIVRGTVRCLRNEVKIRPLLNLCPDSKYPLELVEADLNDHDSWDRAIRGCRYVLHVACPFPSEAPKDENEIINPAVNGTLSVLQASHKHRVKRVVYTSSIAAIFGDYSTKDPPGKVFTEDDWTDTETAKDAYIKAKTLAERAAWNFVAELPEGERFELAVLNPTAVFGPLLCGELGTQGKIVKRVLGREMPLIPRINFGAVDVRDVALAHMRAMTLSQAAGRRTMVHSGTNLWAEDMAKILEHEFGPQGYDVPTRNCPYALLRLIALTDKTARMALPIYGKVQIYDGSKTRSILGITPRDVRQSIVDMSYSLIERGFVKKTSNYHGPPSDDSNTSSHS